MYYTVLYCSVAQSKFICVPCDGQIANRPLFLFFYFFMISQDYLVKSVFCSV